MKLLCAISLVITLGAFTVPSGAREVNLQKMPPDSLKAFCEKIAGSYSQDNSG